MNIQLLEWALFIFMIGIALSLPLAALYYPGNFTAPVKQIIINPRKLKSAHIDYFMQTFALGFVYVLEFVRHDAFPMFVVIPLIFGSIVNPTILLLEATHLPTSPRFKPVHLALRGLSPVSLFFSWGYIAQRFLPLYLGVIFIVLVLLGALVFLPSRRGQQSNLPL